MSLNQQIKDLINNRPKYNIAAQYGQNQALATSQAFGRDRSIQQQESNIEQDSANTVNDAQMYSSSTSGLLDALSKITSNKNSALRGLAADESAIQNQKISQLYGANTAQAEEQDKAWNYNVNQPYQLKLNALVQRKKNRSELLSKGLDLVGSAAAFALGGPLGAGVFKGASSGGQPGSTYQLGDMAGWNE